MSDQEEVTTTSQQLVLKPLPWHMMLCRQLWPIFVYTWGSLITGVVVGTTANLNTLTTSTPLSQLFIIHLALTFPIPYFLSLGLLVAMTVLCAIGKGELKGSRTLSRSRQNRIRFLHKLNNRYTSILDDSLRGVAQIPLTLHNAPDAVLNTTHLRFRQANLPEQALPDGTSLLQIYDRSSGELLILGDPGSGKTTLLFNLAKELLQRAIQDEQAPLPVVVNLSTWANTRAPLEDWLIEEIGKTYDIPHALILQWVQEDQLLPLFDGLDEIEKSIQATCIRCINTYHHQHLGPLIVCSRRNEYKTAAQRTRLTLHTAVVLQPLTASQVDAHLAQLGKPLAALRSTIKKNNELRLLAMTPLMLNVLILTYRGVSIRASSTQRSHLQQQVLTDYVQRVLYKGNITRYPSQPTHLWLGWLARQMQGHNQATFFLEDLQSDWLPMKEQTFYRWSIRLINGFLGLLLGGVVNFVIGGTLDGIISGLLYIPIFLWLFGRDLKIKPRQAVAWSPEGARLGFWFGLGFGVIFKIIFGLVLKALNPLVFFLTTPLFECMGILAWGFSEKQISERNYRTSNEGIWRSAKIGLLTALLISIFPGVFSIGAIDGLALGLLGVAILGLRGGLQAFLRHFVLRFWLWRAHLFPWNATRFLDDATSRILLRRIGGGYSFVHRLLLDYFADLETTETTLVSPNLLPAPLRKAR